MLELHVTGMTCQHCVRAVTEAVQGVAPAATVTVNLDTGIVRIDPAPSNAGPIEAAITEEGYTIQHAA